MYKTKLFLQLIMLDDAPIEEQINKFLRNNPKVTPINASYSIAATASGIAYASYAMLLYKEEE